MREGYAPPFWKRVQVQGLEDSRITIRVDEDQGLVSSDEVRSCRRAKYKTHRPVNDHLKAFDYFRARWDEIGFAFDSS